MKKLCILFFVLMASNAAWAQMALIKKLLSNEKDTTRKASFMPVPALGYSQEKGLEFGVGLLYSFYFDRKDTLNRSSNFSGIASVSTKGTYNLTLKGDAWGKENDFHYIGEMRFRKMPFNFYGIGNNTAKSDEDLLVQNQIKLAFELEKQIVKNTYTGVLASFENYSYNDKINGGVFTSNPNIFGKKGGSLFFIGLAQSYDTRNSNNYPTKGFYGKISYQYAPNLFGGDNFTGSQIKVNLRNFWGLNHKLALGIQGLYQGVQSSLTPFYVLPQLGSDEMMRGYYTGRYRDENLLAMQTELRYRYSNRFGAVLFAGTGTVFGQSTFTLNNFKPNYGGGLRYFFDPAKGLSIRLDYGIGKKQANEKRQTGFYISLAEAF